MNRAGEFNRISYIECTCGEVVIYEGEYGIRHDYYRLKIRRIHGALRRMW